MDDPTNLGCKAVCLINVPKTPKARKECERLEILQKNLIIRNILIISTGLNLDARPFFNQTNDLASSAK